MLATLTGAPPVIAKDAATPDRNGCLLEAEPNDTPDEAGAAMGSVCLAGVLPLGDQDLFLWEVTAADSLVSWTITVDGVPGARTVVDLRPVTSDPGVVPLALAGPLLVMTFESDADEPAVQDDVLLAPGRYLAGVSAGGQPEDPGADLGYTVTLVPGAPMPPAGDIEPNDDAATAAAVLGSFTLSGDLAGSPDTYRWSIPPDAAASWTLSSVTQLGTTATLTLSSADGSSVLVRAQPTDGRIELPDLVLDPGEYLVSVGPAASTASPYVLAAQASETLTGDPEPNDSQDRAVPLTGEKPLVRGRLARPQDDDWFRLDVNEALAAGTVDIRMLWNSGLRRELCLYGARPEALLCRGSTSGLNVAGLSLPVGSYALRVRGDAAADDTYLIRVDPAGTIGADFEREPNDTPETATTLEAGTSLRARALGADVDEFGLTVTGDPQLWQVEAHGTGLTSLDWIRPNGELLGSAAIADDGTSATLSDLYLTPGEQWLRVTATDADYAVTSTPLGPPDPNGEREPNDLPAREERLLVGRERVGRLPTPTDTDIYRFTVRGTDHLLLKVVPPVDGEIDVLLMDGIGLSRRLHATADEPVRDDLLLGPGDYRVLLTPIVTSQERYSIDLERLDPFEPAIDQEPNDSPRQARAVPATGEVQGTAATDADTDWYVLPPSADGSPVRIVTTGDITAMALRDAVLEQALFAQPDGVTYESGPVAPGGSLLLRVSASGPYSLTLADGAEAAPMAGSAFPIEAELALADVAVAAWWPTGQRLRGTLRLSNPGTGDVRVTLEASASDRAWRVNLPEVPVPVPAGGRTEVPVEVLVPRDVPGDDPVRISIRATRQDGAAATASADVGPSREAFPAEQVRTWPVADALLGGLDAASLALGATPIPSLDPMGEERLHDGVVAPDWGLSYPIGSLPVSLTVDLAGDEPVPVAGTILQPFSEDPTLGDAARDFELALSKDGGTWETVLRGTLDPVSAEQAFVLDQPVEARFAQLRITSVHREVPSRINLGEWKVVARPGWSPAGSPIDLADPRAGGHIVWMSPQPDPAAQAASQLADDPSPQSLIVEKGSAVEWTLGFMDDRAALVSSLGWQDPVPSDGRTRLGRVEVSASADSPLGPWESLGTWTLERGADGAVTPFTFEALTWVRFLRLSGVTGRKQSQVELPDRIRVLEAPQGSTYRSVLGQWGMGQRDGPLEWFTAPAELGQDDEGVSLDDPGHPRDLAEGGSATGRVHFGEDTDWYRVSIPDGQHSLALTVDGPLSLGAALTLQTLDGIAVPMVFGPGEDPGSVTYLASVEPSASYVVEVSQPQSSIVVSFDSSASVATQVSAIESGLRALAEGMSGDREAVRMVPFDNHPLLPDWSSDPYEIAAAVNRFRLDGSSSAVESNLREAALDLASREGGRAILLITDAASSSRDQTARLWAALSTSRPQVFTVAVGGEGEAPAIERHHLMADWAASAGGVSSQARGGEEILQSFDRLATWMRRPVAYSLTYQTFPEEPPPPPPGRISVLAPQVDGRRPAILRGDAAIELVVDTSGSMRKRLGDLTRIEVAKQVLTELVRDDIPAGAPVALRRFPPASDPCDSVLLIPLGPLDPVSTTATIDELSAPRKAQTPLARAIAAVADDLENVTGPRIVVVVSDGKESCKGDPATEVERLRDQGFDVTLNVVGLALDRTSRKNIARLAELGGGSYFGAADPETLGAALRAAVSAPFEIRDGSGAVLGRGTVGGDPVEVPMGRYDVTVLTDPVVTFAAVFLRPDADITLTLPIIEGEA